MASWSCPACSGRTRFALLIDTFMAMHAGGPIPGCFNPVPDADDILKRFPRMMHPHRVNDTALRYLLDPRLGAILDDLFGEEPLAAQSMLYFKPAGARGQALHQDNFYLKVDPGTCIAAWVALDPADRENGGLEVVPGTHKMDLFCPEEADLDVSFTREYVAAAARSGSGGGRSGRRATSSSSMAPLVHGSGPNRSAGPLPPLVHLPLHARSAERMSSWYRPILTMSGEEVVLDANTDGGPCGTEASGPH